MQRALQSITNHLLLLSSGDVYKAYDTFHRNLPDVDNSPLAENTDRYDELLFNYDKIIVEKMVQKEMFNVTVLRLPAVFGPDDKQQKLGEYIKPMITNQPFIKLSTKKANWVWTRSYVENVAYGIYLAATHKEAQNQVFNLGDIHLKEVDLITRLKELSG